MARTTRIESVAFGAAPLPLPVSVRLSRRAEPRPAIADEDAFAASVELGPPVLSAEVRLRDTSAAEGLSLGQQDDLTFTVQSAEAGTAGRNVTLSGAVLVAVELSYEQTDVAAATLRFVAESATGSDPFAAGDAP
jgi:hypothetical protein